VKKYFENQINSNSRTIHPIYLQHDGHSRTIVGIEEGVDHGLSLIIFDPSTRRNQIEKFRQAKYKNLSLFKRGVGVFNKKKEYQLLIIQGSFKNNQEYEVKCFFLSVYFFLIDFLKHFFLNYYLDVEKSEINKNLIVRNEVFFLNFELKG